MSLFNIVPNIYKAATLSTSVPYYAFRPYNASIVLGINDVGYPSGWWNGKTPPSEGYTIYIPNQTSASTVSTRIANNNNQLISVASYVSNTTITNVYDAFLALINNNCVVLNYNLPNFPTVGLSAFILAGFSQSFPEAFTGLSKIWWSGNDATITTPTKNYFDSVDNLTMDSITMALVFNGSSQYCTIHDSTNIPIGNSSYTMACWFNTNVIGGAYGLVGWGNYGNNNQANAFRLTSDGNLVNYWWSNDLTTSGLNLQTDTWYCGICTYDAISNTRTIYLNGNNVAQDNPSGTHNVTTSTNTTIGYTGTGSALFNGLLFNAAIYNQAFSAQNASDYYQAILPLVTNSSRQYNLLINPSGSIATTQSIENINIQHQ
jgi:hypothetical protein